MPSSFIRDFYKEKEVQNAYTQRLIQRQSRLKTPLPEDLGADLRRHIEIARFEDSSLEDKTHQYHHNREQYRSSLQIKHQRRNEPFEFFSPTKLETIPENRIPAEGIKLIPHRFHTSNPIYANDQVPETGFPLHPEIKRLLKTKYPHYYEAIAIYCRPLGTTDATFADFNRPQREYPIFRPDLIEDTMKLVKHFLNAKKFRPLHFCDVRFTKIPLSTGTGYFNKHSYDARTHARYSHPDIPNIRRTSKLYYINTTLERTRSRIHVIKETGTFSSDPQSPEDEERFREKFYYEHPTQIHVRNHISKRNGALKQRPVYAVDDEILFTELMLTFPLITGARNFDCGILYGIETIRGGMRYVDHLAQSFNTYAMLDYSSFDQMTPWSIALLFYTKFLPDLIIVNKGYQPSYEYPDSTIPTEEFAEKIDNLMNFLTETFTKMIFVTADGYAYRRTCAGIPSGQFTTQYLDSFVNLYIILESLLDYGFTSEEIIRKFEIQVMGDDNIIYSSHQPQDFCKFIRTLPDKIKERYGMKINTDKSSVTTQRNNIEILGYKCNFGSPKRDMIKLVAQLVYPEHGVTLKYMSYRAIGIAYAAAGQDHTFHSLCEDIYHLFKEYMAPMSSETQETLSKHIYRMFTVTDAFSEICAKTDFPSLEEVQDIFKEWKGPLDYAPRWDFTHFINIPDETLDDVITLSEYRKSKMDKIQ